MGDVPYSTGVTLPETNIINSSHLKNGWLEDYYFPFGKPYFQTQTVSLREGTPLFRGNQTLQIPRERNHLVRG